MFDSDDFLFSVPDFFLVRTPLLPVDYFFSSLVTRYPNEFVLEFFNKNNQFREAIAAASEELHREAVGLKKDIRCASSLFRYFLRMTNRSTPFGIFSFVSWGGWGENSQAFFSLEKVKKRSRPDMEWLLNTINDLSTQSEIIPFLKIKTNPLIDSSSNRIQLGFIRRKDGKSVSIRTTLLVKTILHVANQSSGLNIHELIEQTIFQLPGSDYVKIEEMIYSLIDLQFLHFDLTPSLLTSSPFKDLLEKLLAIPLQKNKQIDLLLELSSDIESYNKLQIGNGESALENIQKKMRQVGFSSKMLQIDTFYNETGVTLSRSIIPELKEAVEFLWKITSSPAHLYLREYHARFIEKYGTNRTIPLLDLLNEDVGLGVPEIYKKEEPTTFKIEPNKKNWGEWLQKKWTESLFDNTQEILISDDVIEEFFPITQKDKEKAPLSFELCFEILTDSKEHLDRGDFMISISHYTKQGGASFGRFLDLFGPEKIEQLKNFYLHEESLEENCLYMESSYLPLSPRDANVSIRPLLREHAISLSNSQKQFSLSDIYVGATIDRLYLTTKEGQKELKFITGDLLNPIFAPDPLRFIRDISEMPYRFIHSFSWGPLEEASFLPRLKYKKIILSPARWNLDFSDLNIGKNDKAEIIANKFKRWAKKWKMPRYVFIIKKENRLLLDISHDFHIQEIICILKKEKRIKFYEKINQRKSEWINSDKGHHVSEFIIPFIKNGKYASSKSPSLFPYYPLEVSDRWKIPGSEWLSVKFYLKKESENYFLIQKVKSFCNELENKKILESWFFTRYSDPKNHLRIRFKFTSSMLNYDWIHIWIKELLEEKWISDFQFTGYEREVERYGGKNFIEEAESFFCNDSQKVLDTIQRKIQLPDFIKGTLSILELLEKFGLSHADQITFLSENDLKKELLVGFREWKKTILAWMKNNLFKEQGSNPYLLFNKLNILNTRHELTTSPQNILNSLVHMHFNRLLGCDLYVEQKIRAFAFHSLTTWKKAQLNNSVLLS
jgi:thiopeptide-type bacteriocin biosynthesis protein